MITIPTKFVSVRELAVLCKEYYKHPDNGAWGSLHIALDDSNLSDSSIVFCLVTAVKRNDELGQFIAKNMLEFTETQRRKLRALANER